MKKIILFIIISTVVLSAPKINDNKIITELQLKIDKLEKKINEQELEYLELKVETNKKLSVNQFNKISKLQYQESAKKVEELYSKSFENYDKTIIIFLGFLGILMAIVGALFTIIKIVDSKKYKELKTEMIDDLKDKKDEIEKYNDKNNGNMMLFINYNIESIDKKIKELEELKVKIQNLELDMKSQYELVTLKLTEANKDVDRKIILLDKSFNEKMKEIGVQNIRLEKELRQFLNTEKDKIKKEVSESYKKDIAFEIESFKENFLKTETKSLNINEENDIVVDENINITQKIKEAKRSYRKKDYQKSINILEDKYLKNDYNTNYWLGLSNYRLKNYEEAIYYFKIAKELCPTKIKQYYVNYWLGITYKENDNYEDAINVLKVAVELAPTKQNQYNSNYFLGMAYSEKGNLDEAKKYLEVASKLAETSKKIFNSHFELGKNYAISGNNDEAIKVFNIALDNTSNSDDKFYVFYWLGMTFFSKNEYNQSLDYFLKSKAYEHEEFEDSYGYHWLAKVYLSLDDLKNATIFVEQILLKDSEDKIGKELQKEINKKNEEK